MVNIFVSSPLNEKEMVDLSKGTVDISKIIVMSTVIYLIENNPQVMVLYAPGLVPARFLTLLSHLTVVILVFCSRRENVEACLSLDSTEEEFQVKDFQLSIGLIISIVLLGIELIGFLSGVSMFMPSAAIISIGGHFSGSIALSYFIFDQWDCNIYWWIFSFCSVIPAIVEIIVAFGVIALRKS